MSQLPLEQAVLRFRQNEERIDIFVNDTTPDSSYTTSGGQQVETINSLIARLSGGGNSETVEVNFGESGTFAEAVIPATWVTPSTTITAQLSPNLTDHDFEDLLLDQVKVQVGSVVDGVSVTVFVHAPETTWGRYVVTIRG